MINLDIHFRWNCVWQVFILYTESPEKIVPEADARDRQADNIWKLPLISSEYASQDSFSLNHSLGKN